MCTTSNVKTVMCITTSFATPLYDHDELDFHQISFGVTQT